MKILMIAPTPFFADRGCHTQIYEEIKALQKLGHEIVLCTYGIGRNLPDVKIVRTINFFWYNKLSAGPSYTKILILPFLFFTVLRAALKFKPEVVHAHLHEGAVIARILKFFLPRKKYIFDMQGTLTGECVQHGFAKKGSFIYRFLLWFERKIDNWFFTITQSDSMIKELLAFGVPEQRCANVHDGVDTEIFRPLEFDNELAAQLNIKKECPRIIYMGLLVTYQGADVMFEAFSKVHKMLPDAQFIIIGFPNIDVYTEQCRKYGILENTRFLGRIDYWQLPRYLSLADVAVAPKIALTEGDGKIYNYMAMGMLTVAFDRSVSREILDDTGIFAEFNNADSMAQKIVWGIQHPQESKAIGLKARERAIEHLSWDAVGQRINQVYNKL